jgi:hypothetical protein
MSSITETKADGGGNDIDSATNESFSDVDASNDNRISTKTGSKSKPEWSIRAAKVPYSSLPLSKPPSTAATKKVRGKKKIKSQKSITSSNNVLTASEAATENATAFLDELIVTNYTLKEHTKKLERDFESLQTDVARLSEHCRQYRIQLKTCEEQKAELAAANSVLQKEISLNIEKSATFLEKATRAESANMRLTAELRASRSIADGAIVRAEKAEAAVHEAHNSVEGAEVRIDELKTQLLRANINCEQLNKQIKKYQLIERKLENIQKEKEAHARGLTDRDTQTKSQSSDEDNLLELMSSSNKSSSRTSGVASGGHDGGIGGLSRRRFLSPSPRRKSPSSNRSPNIDALGQIVVQHLVESGLLQSVIQSSSPSSEPFAASAKLRAFKNDIRRKSSPTNKMSKSSLSLNESKETTITEIKDNSILGEKGQNQDKNESQEKLATHKVITKKLKDENVQLKTQLKRAQLLIQQNTKKNKVMQQQQQQQQKIEKKKKQKTANTKKKSVVDKRKNRRMIESSYSTSRSTSRSRSRSRSSTGSSSAGSRGRSNSSRSRSRSRSSSRSSNNSGSGSGSSYSSVRSRSDSNRSVGVSEGDALEMLKRFDSEFARVMAATNASKKIAPQIAPNSSNNNASSTVAIGKSDKKSKSYIRPATAIPKRSSPTRAVLSRPFSSNQLRGGEEEGKKKKKNKARPRPERPNDKERRSARRRNNKSLNNSRSVARVYGSIGKKSQSVDRIGRWR